MGPQAPNGGLLFTLGPLGVDVSDLAALDSAPAPGAGVLWAAAQPAGATASALYTINAPGTAPVGEAVSRGTIAAPVLGSLSIAPGGGVRVPAAFTPGTEAGPAAVVRVERRGDTLAPVSVAYRTVDRTAVAGSDYTPVSGTLAFGHPDMTAPVFLAAPQVPDSVAVLRRAGRLRVSFALLGAVHGQLHAVAGTHDIGVGARRAPAAGRAQRDAARAPRRPSRAQQGTARTEPAKGDARPARYRDGRGRNAASRRTTLRLPRR